MPFNLFSIGSILVGLCLAFLASPVMAQSTKNVVPPPRADVAAQASLLIQSSPLAGSQYHALADVVEQIRVGDPLSLQREPDNPHDTNAIRVLWHDQMLGYVPRRENKAVARAMDRGTPLIARVVALRPDESPWRRLRFEISMPLDPTPVRHSGARY